MYQVAKLTGWGYRQIMWEIPFTAGLQLLHAESFAHGITKRWKRNNTSALFDFEAEIDAAFAKL